MVSCAAAKSSDTCRCRRPLGADMLPHNAMMLTTGDDEASPFTPLGVVNTPCGQTPQVCTVLCDRVMRSNTHNSIPPNPFARNTTCMAVRSDPERPTDTIRLAMRVCEGQDPLLRLSFLSYDHKWVMSGGGGERERSKREPAAHTLPQG